MLVLAFLWPYNTVSDHAQFSKKLHANQVFFKYI